MHGLPSTTKTLLRGLTRRRPGLRDTEIPRIERQASDVRASQEWLDAYRALTDSPVSDFLPLLAPQMIAGPLHAQVLSDPSMPIGVLGLVHVSQGVVQHHPVPRGAPLQLEVWVEGQRPARQGAELDVHTRVHADGALCWEGVTSALARGPWKDPDAPGAPKEDEPLPLDGAEAWIIREDIGRRWRRVSGDPNPIHLHRMLARPFGFKAAIAHGTWLLARACGHLGEAEGPARLACRFRRPVFLPAEASFRRAAIPGGERFSLRDPRRDKRHLEGELVRGETHGDPTSD